MIGNIHEHALQLDRNILLSKPDVGRAVPRSLLRGILPQFGRNTAAQCELVEAVREAATERPVPRPMLAESILVGHGDEARVSREYP